MRMRDPQLPTIVSLRERILKHVNFPIHCLSIDVVVILAFPVSPICSKQYSLQNANRITVIIFLLKQN